MTESERIQVNTLSDDPVSEDAFGSHQKIAEAIKSMVETEEGGKAIALEGTWGSGKSTVVKILSDLCERERATKQSTLVYTFDSWAHRGDPLRRSFFETAVEKLDVAGWTKAICWKKAIDRLAGRCVEKTTTRPRITMVGIFYSIAIAIAPVGLVLLNKQTDAIKLEPTFALILSVVPVLLVALVFILWIIAHILGIFWVNCKESLLKFLSPVSSKIDSTVDTSTVRTNDPTSIEFRIEFQKLLDRALKDTKRRLVIVIDNLDRVGAETALSIWSNLRTFFHFDDTNSSGWGNRVWLIVPFSQDGISELWDNSKNKDATAKSFEAKAFQVKFRVPQPVLSDWVTYFMEQLDRAFHPNLEESEAQAVYWIYRQKVYPSIASPTPRDIKAFINRVGTLMRYRGPEIRPRIQALYAALEMQEDLETRLTALEPKLLGTINPNVVGKDYQAELIALHYGVTMPLARQLLLRKPLEKAIECGEPDYLRSSRGIPGFTICCEEHVDKVVQYQTDPRVSHIVASAASVFAQLEIVDDRHWRHMWKLLRDAALSVESWETFDETTGDGLAKLIERNRGKDLGGKFLASISASSALFQDKDDQPLEDEAIRETVSGISLVIGSLLSIGFEPSKLELPGTPAVFHRVMRLWISDTENGDLANHVVPKGDKDQVLATMAEAIGKGKYDDRDYRVLELWLSQDKEWKLETIVPNIENRLATDQISLAELRPLLSTLLLLHDLNPAKEALKRLTADAHILSPFGRLYGSLQTDDKAVCVYLTLLHNPDGAAAEIGSVAAGRNQYAKLLANPDADADLLEAILELYLEHSEVTVLLTHADRTGKPGTFCKALVNVMVGKEDVVRRVTPDQVIEHWRVFYDSLEAKGFESLILRFTVESDLVAKLLSHDFNAEYTTLYLAVLKQAKGQMREKMEGYLVEHLRQVDHKRWSEDADIENISIFDLVVALSKNDVRLQLGSSYQAALSQLVSTHLKSDGENQRLLSMWRWLLSGLNDSLRNTFLRHHLDKIIHPTQDAPVERLVTLFTPELLGCGFLEETADPLVRNVLDRILDSQSGDELDWLHQTLTTCPNVCRKCHKDTSKALQDRISHFLSEESELSDEFRAKIEKISELLDVANS